MRKGAREDSPGDGAPERGTARADAAPRKEPPAVEVPGGGEGTGAASDGTPAEGGESPPARPPGGKLLQGAVVAPGLAMGLAHHKDYDLTRAGTERVPLDEVDRELNRFRKALDESRLQLLDLRSRIQGRVEETDARILDTHLAYLKDSVFIADVENLILNEQMRLDAAIAKVVGDFDRIFRLVQNDALKQSAVDLRDVGIRVLRNLERYDEEGVEDEPVRAGEYVLVARELSIVDMFDFANEHVLGIATKEGGLTSHAAIFARSMGIPTITGVEHLLEEVQEGDFLILDATEGILRVGPDEVVRSQYKPAKAEEAVESESDGDAPEWALAPARTLDGVDIEVTASCGSLPEVEQSARLGARAVGLYRTELLFVVDRQLPSRESLVQHYATVIGGARGRSVTFRLLNADSTLEIGYLHERREPNPALGLVGVRALLGNEAVLRRQLKAILIAGADAPVRIAVPFVTDCGEVRRVKEVLFEERFELRKAGERFQDEVEVGVVIETPASLLGVRDLAQESDFLLLNLDSLREHVLASDRATAESARELEALHPFVLRALTKVSAVAEAVGRPLHAFGVSATRAENLPYLIGAGVRRFCVPPADLRPFLETLREVDARRAGRATRSAAKSACPADTDSLVAGFRHGYAGP